MLTRGLEDVACGHAEELVASVPELAALLADPDGERPSGNEDPARNALSGISEDAGRSFRLVFALFLSKSGRFQPGTDCCQQNLVDANKKLVDRNKQFVGGIKTLVGGNKQFVAGYTESVAGNKNLLTPTRNLLTATRHLLLPTPTR